MKNPIATLCASATTFVVLISSAAHAHIGEHTGDFSETMSHMITSPWHQMSWLFPIALIAAVLMSVFALRKLR